MRRADDVARLESFMPAASRIATTYAAHGEAADLHQEILTQLWRSRRHFDGQSEYATWAYRVALNTAIDHVRRDRHRKTTLERFRLLNWREAKSGTLIPDSVEVQVIKAFCDTLDVAERSLFTLYLEALDYARISDVLGISSGACRTRLSRLKSKFKQHIAGEDLEH